MGDGLLCADEAVLSFECGPADLMLLDVVVTTERDCARVRAFDARGGARAVGRVDTAFISHSEVETSDFQSESF